MYKMSDTAFYLSKNAISGEYTVDNALKVAYNLSMPISGSFSNLDKYLVMKLIVPLRDEIDADAARGTRGDPYGAVPCGFRVRPRPFSPCQMNHS
jgi:hypothetical protein